MKVWITQYALTQGIHEMETVGPDKDSPSLIRVGPTKTGEFAQYFHKPHWHSTYEEARGQAESMRSKKIGALKKQIAKLEKMTFGGES